MLVLAFALRQSVMDLCKWMVDRDIQCRNTQKTEEEVLAYGTTGSIVVRGYSYYVLLPIEWLSEDFKPTQEGR